MSTHPVSPKEIKKEFGLKRLFMKAAGFGAGFAIVFCLTAAGVIWYAHRPVQPKPWNKTAFKAQFDRVYTSPKTKHFIFDYIIENTSDSDYRLNSTLGVNLTVESSGHLAMCEECLTLPTLPVFIPARQKMLVPIQLNYTVPIELETQLIGISEDAKSKAVKEYVDQKFKHLDGFILYDENNRFEIVFPKGWGDGK
jgi:hypothetical protein